MNEKEIERYIIARKTVSIPEVQKRFGLGYKETHSYFMKLVNEEMIVLKDDLCFEYCVKIEKIPPLYLKILWDCIKRNDVNFDYIKVKYNLSIPTVKTIIKWMKDSEFIEDSPFEDILLSKEEFIERFGSLEEENEEEDEENLTSKDDIKDLRVFLEQRRKELLKKFDALPTKKEEETDILDDIDIKPDIFSLGLDLLNDEVIEEKMKAVITINSKITLEEFLSYVEKQQLNAIISESKEKEVYEKILNVISQFEEEDFEDLKKIILKGE